MSPLEVKAPVQENALHLAQRLINVGIALSAERDLDTLLQLIVSEAKSLTSADAASLYLKKGDRLNFEVICNAEDSLNKPIQRPASFPDIPLPENLSDCNSIAGYVVMTGKTVNIADVYQIPEHSPYAFNPSFDKSSGYHTQSMVTVPLTRPSGEVMGALQLINHIEQGQIDAFPSFATQLAESLASQAAVAYNNLVLEQSLRSAYNDTLCRLSAAAEYRDPETANHLIRMSHYSKIIAKQLGLSAEIQNLIFEASPMHDIGKIGIPDAILLKPGPLTDYERSIMQTHAKIGAKILSGSTSKLMQMSSTIAGSHHEKFDGSGYPKGLQGEDIPLAGRIVALADVFDALASKRVYKEAWTMERVFDFIKNETGRHFDPKVVQAFFDGIDEILNIHQRYKPSAELADKTLSQNFNKSQDSSLKFTTPAKV